MALKNIIVDPLNGKQANVITTRSGNNALIASTEATRSFNNSVKFFTNPTHGRDINKNASAGGTPVKIHNGTDDALWTGSTINGGTFTFDSTDQNHTGGGSKSVKCAAVNVNSEIQFAKGSNQDLTNYESITLWIYLSDPWNANDGFNIYGWDVGVGIVGQAVDIADYITINTTGSWQKATIPLTDLLLTNQTVDAVRVNHSPAQGSPNTFYLDDIQFEEATATGTLTYTIEPGADETLVIDGFNILMVDGYAGTVSNGTMPSLPYNSFLGVAALSNGFTFRTIIDGEITFSENYNQLSDVLTFPNVECVSSGSDGTNTWMLIRIRLTEPIELNFEDADKIELIINDDLTGLLLFQVSASCKVEV